MKGVLLVFQSCSLEIPPATVFIISPKYLIYEAMSDYSQAEPSPIPGAQISSYCNCVFNIIRGRRNVEGVITCHITRIHSV